MKLTLADGQLSATAATVYSGDARIVTINAYNTSASSSETVSFTFQRNGGTARGLHRAILAPYERVIISGVCVETADTILGSATDAATVDYLVTIGSGPFNVSSFDASGALKQVNTGVAGNQTISGTLTVSSGLVNTTTLTAASGASTAAAGSTTSDAGVLPAATASVYPTTAADDTKGVRIHADDKVTGRLLFIGNGVSDKILKVYAPSGGTINGAAADAAFSSASGKGVFIYCLSSSGNTWLAW